MKPKTVRRLLGCVAELLLLAFVLLGLTSVTERKSAEIKYHDFFEQQADFDVLFFGTSHMQSGVYPPELWKDYGIVSYNLGAPGCNAAVMYWVLQDVLDYTTPRLVVIDGYNALVREEKTDINLSLLHTSFDAFPLSRTKIRAVFDLMDDDIMAEEIAAGKVRETEKRVPSSLLWDFTVYHDRWSELNKNDFIVSYTPNKGANYLTPVVPQLPPDRIPKEDVMEKETVGFEYIRRMIEACRQRGIDVVLTYLPFSALVEQQQEANSFCEIAEEYGIPCIDFLDLDVVDYRTDCSDANTHLNVSGVRKITDYFGRFITENYDVPDQRGNPAYAAWYEDYEEYTQFKVETLQEQEQLDVYLMLLADKNYDVVLYLEDTALIGNREYSDLLHNMGVDTQAPARCTERCFITKAGGQPAEVWPVQGLGAQSWSTPLGMLQMDNETVTLNGAPCMTLQHAQGEGDFLSLYAAVFGAEGSELLDTAVFNDGYVCVGSR